VEPPKIDLENTVDQGFFSGTGQFLNINFGPSSKDIHLPDLSVSKRLRRKIALL
jgi:hypothetical protein